MAVTSESIFDRLIIGLESIDTQNQSTNFRLMNLENHATLTSQRTHKNNEGNCDELHDLPHKSVAFRLTNLEKHAMLTDEIFAKMQQMARDKLEAAIIKVADLSAQNESFQKNVSEEFRNMKARISELTLENKTLKEEMKLTKERIERMEVEQIINQGGESALEAIRDEQIQNIQARFERNLSNAKTRFVQDLEMVRTEVAILSEENDALRRFVAEETEKWEKNNKHEEC
ncbi:hypothetical protein L596_001663 [Steinernema carpocapsae]|uniref:Uncharacterized protein n=1 Tax=Steinernema carpocapsae TaxID=34508 RepID=A0A4U8ULQ2_STECR|nr:hypothetical protein L596_001663 [Steinernema carpocapsae]